MNVILIVSDTFRYDHLGYSGNNQIRTPYLDRFAEKCVVFDRYYANSFPTVPARADLVTGKYTFTFMGWRPLPSNETTLAQLLTGQGYLTMAVVDTPFITKEGYNYDRGFQDFIYVRGQSVHTAEGRDVRPYRFLETDYAAPATMLTAERWLQRHYKENFFFYVDTWDPHEPWDAPSWYTELYYPGYDGRIVQPCYGKYKERGVSEDDLRIAHACYCGEVTMVDRWVGRLLGTVEALNLMDKTAIIFTSDHGFYFGEHGYFGKTVFNYDFITGQSKGAKKQLYIYRSPLYEEVAHIPLLVYVPGYKPRRADAIVSLADIVPTILDLAQVEIPGHVQAKPMTSILEGEDNIGKEFAVTSHALYNPGEVTRAVDTLEKGVLEPLPATITTKSWSLIYSSQGQPSELYHLPSDPRQEKNVFQDNLEIAKEIHHKFVSFLEEKGTESHLIEPRRRL